MCTEIVHHLFRIVLLYTYEWRFGDALFYRIPKEELTLICGLSESEKSSARIVVALKPARIILCYQPSQNIQMKFITFVIIILKKLTIR